MRDQLIEILEGAGKMIQFPGSLANILIENGVTIQKWIPITERLPKGIGKVLVVKSYRGKPYIDVGEIIEGKAYCFSDEYAIHPSEHKLTHWMPLPEPPK